MKNRIGIFLILTLLLFQIGWSQNRYDQRPHGQGGASTLADDELSKKKIVPQEAIHVGIRTENTLTLSLSVPLSFNLSRKEAKQIQPILFYSVAIVREGEIVSYERLFVTYNPAVMVWNVLLPISLQPQDTVLVSITEPSLLYGKAVF